MNRTPANDLDDRARALHRASLSQVSPQTLARLRAARGSVRASHSRRAWPWLAATAFSGLLALFVGVQWLPSNGAGDAPVPVAAQPARTNDASADSTTAMLDENPELYLWLASSEAQPLAME